MFHPKGYFTRKVRRDYSRLFSPDKVFPQMNHRVVSLSHCGFNFHLTFGGCYDLQAQIVCHFSIPDVTGVITLYLKTLDLRFGATLSARRLYLL